MTTTYSIHDEAYWDAGDLDDELLRVFDICQGCRLCFKFCPSFPTLFDYVDNNGEDVANLTHEHKTEVMENCFQCKLCYINCPYIPPHRYNLDFPRLMMRFKNIDRKKNGVSIRDRFLGSTDLLSMIGPLFAPLMNFMNSFGPFRAVLDAVMGVEKSRALPQFTRHKFSTWMNKRMNKRVKERAKESEAPAVVEGARKVVLFHTCYVDMNEPNVGKAAVQVLEKNNIEVASPKQKCCGMPYLDGGDIKTALKNAKYNIDQLLPYVDDGYDIVVPGPTCSYMIKKEYPEFVEGDESRRVAEHTFDLFEYLRHLHREEALNTEFKNPLGTISLHAPCHLRAQYIGTPARDVLALVPDTEVMPIAECSAHDGTWAMKKEYHPLSLKYGKKLFDKVEANDAHNCAGDCPLAASQVAEGGVKQKMGHPIILLNNAYGLESVDKI